jgi:hypothetical protein
MGAPPPVAELLAQRAWEEMALNDRHLNPQLGRIVRTLGFDRRWVAGDGAHLVDADGERFLDLLQDARERRGMTPLVVTYDGLIGERADRVLHLRDGRLVDAGTGPALRPAQQLRR